MRLIMKFLFVCLLFLSGYVYACPSDVDLESTQFKILKPGQNLYKFKNAMERQIYTYPADDCVYKDFQYKIDDYIIGFMRVDDFVSFKPESGSGKPTVWVKMEQLNFEPIVYSIDLFGKYLDLEFYHKGKNINGKFLMCSDFLDASGDVEKCFAKEFYAVEEFMAENGQSKILVFREKNDQADITDAVIYQNQKKFPKKMLSINGSEEIRYELKDDKLYFITDSMKTNKFYLDLDLGSLFVNHVELLKYDYNHLETMNIKFDMNNMSCFEYSSINSLDDSTKADKKVCLNGDSAG